MMRSAVLPAAHRSKKKQMQKKKKQEDMNHVVPFICGSRETALPGPEAGKHAFLLPDQVKLVGIFLICH